MQELMYLHKIRFDVFLHKLKSDLNNFLFAKLSTFTGLFVFVFCQMLL